MSESIEVESIRRLDVKPGETLVVNLGRDTRPEEFDAICRSFKGRFPDGVKVLCLAGDVDLSVIATSEADRIAEAVRKATENPGKTFEVGE